jgi:DNA-binding MarR family transcriptional regulator
MAREDIKKQSAKAARDMAGRCLSFALRKADRAAMQIYDEALRPAGVRMTQFSVLAAVRLLGPVQMTALARAAVMDRTTLTRNLALLEREGLVRIAGGADRRSKEIMLTAKGHRTLAGAYGRWREAQARVEARLGKARARELVDDLAATVGALAEG